MTCNACGEKPKDTAKDFTKAVIEINNPETLVLLRKVVIPASMGTEEDVPATIGKYHNVILHYEANKHTYLYSSDGIPTLLEMKIPQELLDRIDELEENLAQETTIREDMDEELQSNIDAVAQDLEDFKNSPDVVDIVSTYAALQAYDASKLGDNDEIRVLTDETHDGASAYYRWDKTNSQWIFIGITGPYYTKNEIDTTVQGIEGDIGDLSTLTTTNKTSTVAAINEVVSGLTPVVQTTGTSTTDVMSQNSTTKMIYSDTNGTDKKRICIGSGAISAPPSNYSSIAIGVGASERNYGGIALGENSVVNTSVGGHGIAIGQNASVTGSGSNGIAIGGSLSVTDKTATTGREAIAIGYGAKATDTGSIALGARSTASTTGEMNIGSSVAQFGYNSSNYRLLTGLYDPQSAHDAATKGYVDGLVGDIDTALQVILNGGES